MVVHGVRRLLVLTWVAITCSGCNSGSNTESALGPATRPHNISARLDTETYASIQENAFVMARDVPQSTFSIDVDTASYSNVRRILREGRLPPPGAVRLEEFVNYFEYDYPQPQGVHPFSVGLDLAASPWNTDHQLLRIALRGRSHDIETRPSCNLVFLIDVSGSMLEPNKLPLVRSALRLMLASMTPADRIAIVVYAGAAGLVLDSTPANQASTILGALDRVEAGGSTNGGAGIDLAYRIAQTHFMQEGVNRVILCTDGDFNVGPTDPADLVALVAEHAARNIFLTVLGFGSGNLKDATLEQIADRGNGNYAYIDNLLEAQKVLVEQLGATLVTIAKDVKLQVEFNPDLVESYRLVGYENRVLANREFRDDQVDAGEIGAGHVVTAFYEIRRTDADDKRFIPLSEAAHAHDISGDPARLLSVRLRYKSPTGAEAKEFEVALAGDVMPNAHPDLDFGFASAVLTAGMLLRDSRYVGTADWAWVRESAQQNLGADRRGLRSEFVQLAGIAQQLSR